MTCVAAVRLLDGRILMCSDAAVGYASGYRRTMQEGKWWADYQECVIGESGTDFALSRVKHLFSMMVEPEKKKTEPHEPTAELLAECVRQVQRDVKGDEGIQPIECEMLYCDEDTIAVVGGDGGIVRYREFAVIGHGQPACEPQLINLIVKQGFQRTENVMRKVLFDCFDVTSKLCDSVCANDDDDFFIEAFDF